MIPPPGNPGQPPPPPIVDVGNSLLQPTPAQLTIGQAPTPQGQMGVLTIRTTSTTLTVLLPGKELKVWADLISGLAGSMSGNGLVTGTVIPGSLGQIKPR